MHLRAEYQGLLIQITYNDLTPGKLEQQLKTNPPNDSKEAKEEENE